MPAQLSFISGDLAPNDLDRLSRQFEVDVSALSGVNVRPVRQAHAAGERGDAVTVGTFLLALVTSGTVTALFNIIRSYVDRGIDCAFEGTSADGKPVKIQMKGVSLAQFRDFLRDVGVLK